MNERTMIIVAGGQSSRFGTDKLTADLAGKPLLAHTIDATLPHVDQVVLAVREDLIERFSGPDVIVVPGGESRTATEFNGLAAAPPSMLIGIHDGARPAITGRLINSVFERAAIKGGAVPFLPADGTSVDNEIIDSEGNTLRVQTPQAFWGPELRAAYTAAHRVGHEGRDTMTVVHQFSTLEIALIPGEPSNIKVTHPADLEQLREIFAKRG